MPTRPSSEPESLTTPDVTVVIGGEGRLPPDVARSAPEGLVVAADSGLDVARAAGWPVHHVVGDLDSVDPDALDAAESEGTLVHRHPTDKEATDLDLAVALARSLVGPDVARPHLAVVGPGGGRLDHELSTLLLLAAPALAGCHVTACIGDATVTVVRPGPPVELRGTPGEVISLVPVHGDATGLRCDGLRWPLAAEDAPAGTTRTISNTFVGTTATVVVGAGVVLAIQPGPR